MGACFTRSATLGPQSPASRPEELRVRPWYALDADGHHQQLSREAGSPPTAAGGNQSGSSYPVYPITSYDLMDGGGSSNHREAQSSARGGAEATSTRTSSIESEQQNARPSVPRKAYMDLSDAIAMLDETCPNPDASPLNTPRTPRTPLTPHPRNKRARSKSSDNSSNYSSERLNDRSLDNPKEKERKRPFLKKIGISMTEDRPLLAKFAPRIMGKPYLEKIGPSRAVDKPFLEKIGPSKTLDKFTFDTPKKRDFIDTSSRLTIAEEPENKIVMERRDEIRGFSTGERRKSGKNFLLKMYSFETEDLEDSSLAMKAPHRDPLRGASLDDVLDTGPSSMPRINELGVMAGDGTSDAETPSTSRAELVRCRVTTSEEIISSNSGLNSPMEIISWGNSPRRRDLHKRGQENELTPSKVSENISKGNESVPNSPTKRAHSSLTPERVTAVYKDLDNVKNGRQSSEDILDKRKGRHELFEKRGISSDNLTKERVATPVFAEIGGKDVNGKGSCSSVVSTTSSAKILHDRFDSQEVFTESYAEFKRRTQGNLSTSNALKRLIVREKTISPSLDICLKDITTIDRPRPEGSPKVRSKSAESQRSSSKEKLDVQNRRPRTRSVLRKQQGVDHTSYPSEPTDEDANQRRKMVHEPSQETLDLLSELQKVKSSLKTPSVDKTYEVDNTMELKSFPKKILLTDKEFCLSIERENSVRRPSRVDTLPSPNASIIGRNRSPDKREEMSTLGPALFEKRCLSLDFADEDKSSTAPKTEPRALSLASARSPRSEDLLEASELAFITSDSKSYSSDVFNSPTEEIVGSGEEKSPLATTSGSSVSVEKEVQKIEAEIRTFEQERASDVAKCLKRTQSKEDTRKLEDEKKAEEEKRTEKTEPQTTTRSQQQQQQQQNHYAELEVGSGHRDLSQISPKKRSESLEAPSPKATPFRLKKRLGKISVEESVKQESFTVNKVDCKEVAVQKRAKCLPL